MHRVVVGLFVVSVACDTGYSISRTEQALSPRVELERVTAIRDVSAGEGMTNGALLAGIAESETGLVHCWSEATWACMGPSSPSCDDGPVIAGAGDGPCEDMQGGLGMFQFDGGTFAETLERDGEEILLLEGNIAHAVDFVIDRTIEEIAAANDRTTALSWLNSIPMVAGDPLMEEWASMIVCRYNGCCSSSSLCTMRRDAYRDHAIEYYEEYGAVFWDPSDSCEPMPPAGRTIDDSDPCYVHGGDPQFWRDEASGYEDGSEWTVATDLDEASNYAFWQLDFDEAGRYEVEIFIDPGLANRATNARYVVSSNRGESTRIIDQGASEGWVSLGEFEFGVGANQHVFLGDNTGESGMLMRRLIFDAVRLTRLDPDSEPDPEGGDGGGCGCDATAHSPLGALALLGLMAAYAFGWTSRPRRRRRNCRHSRGG